MSDGWLLGISNRVDAIDGTSGITLETGTVVTGYPLVNLNDPDLALQTRITPSASTVAIKFDMNFSSTSGEGPWAVNAIGLANGNYDGRTVQVFSDTTGTFLSATSRWGPYTLTSQVDNPYLFDDFTARNERYWWVVFSGSSTELTIGRIFLGYASFLGYPSRPESYRPEEIDEPLVTPGGHILPHFGPDPIDTYTLTFRNPNRMTKAVVYDNTMGGGYLYQSYETLYRAFRHTRTRGRTAAGIGYTGTGLAGGGIPTFWHQGTQNGLSTAGRPAKYGYWRLQNLSRHNPRATTATLTFTVREATPKGPDVLPEY